MVSECFLVDILALNCVFFCASGAELHDMVIVEGGGSTQKPYSYENPAFAEEAEAKSKSESF